MSGQDRDGTNTYVYDVENRLVQVTGSMTGAIVYDPLGRIFEYTGGGTTRQFLYDGDALVAEYSGGAMTARYVHGSNAADDPLAWYHGADLSQRRSLFANHQGSVVAIADVSGNQVAINAYDPWGIPNAGNQGRFQYTGQIWLPELGLYHYKARVYSPTLGRFLQTDPIGYADQVNLYAYVSNDPMNAVDPTGQYECNSTEACDAAKKGIKEIRQARDFYRSAPTGSRIARSDSAARAIDGVLTLPKPSAQTEPITGCSTEFGRT